MPGLLMPDVIGVMSTQSDALAVQQYVRSSIPERACSLQPACRSGAALSNRPRDISDDGGRRWCTALLRRSSPEVIQESPEVHAGSVRRTHHRTLVSGRVGVPVFASVTADIGPLCLRLWILVVSSTLTPHYGSSQGVEQQAETSWRTSSPVYDSGVECRAESVQHAPSNTSHTFVDRRWTGSAVLANEIPTPVRHLPAVEVGHCAADGLQVHGRQRLKYLGEGAVANVDA